MESTALFSISTLCLILSAAWMADRLFPRQPLQSLLSFLVLFLISMSLIQLLLGTMGILNPIAVLCGSMAFTLGVVRSFWKRPNPKEKLDPIAGLSQLGIGITVVVGGLGLLPLRSILADAWMQLRSVHGLSWDVVSYHLPNAVTYLQAQTWWIVQGTYGHYPGGNELLESLEHDAAAE